MKTRNLILKLIILATSLQVSAGGEFGNETVTANGQPKSVVLRPCARRLNWEEFSREMEARPEYAGFFRFIDEVYPPLASKLWSEGQQVRICISPVSIDQAPLTLPKADAPRMALWLREGERNKNLLLIDAQLFYSQEVSDAARAATVMRELLHPIFYAIHRDSGQTDWWKRNFVFMVHEAFVQRDQPSRLLDLLNDYGLIAAEDLQYVCDRAQADGCKKLIRF